MIPCAFVPLALFFSLVLFGPPAAAELVITEIMQNPLAVEDAQGEYFEIANLGVADVDLAGYELSDDDSDSFTIEGTLVVAAGDRVVLGRDGDPASNGGLDVDYVFSGMRLSNRDDELVLKGPSGTELDRVAWDDGGTFPDPEGASMSLVNSAADNSLGANWFESRLETFGEGDFGTPGAVNEDLVRVRISNAPAQVDPGDRAELDVTLENPTGRAIQYDAWLKAEGDALSRILLSRPNLTMPGGFELTQHVVLPVPAAVPEGRYTISANIGDAPDLALWSDAVNIRVGTQESGPFPGYTVISSLGGSNTILVDMEGNTIHAWTGAASVASMAHLFPDGSIMRPCRARSPQFDGGALGGRIQHIAWDGSILWDYEWSTPEYCQHHDIEPMPNGNILLISWERKTQAEAQLAGRSRSGEFWPLLIAELEPVGTADARVVWEWHAFDHVIQDQYPTRDNYGVVADHPELLDINYVGNGRGREDWIHANAIDYNPELDQIVFSSHFLDEIYVIDHSTTIEEAAGDRGGKGGKGGDLLYRWGNSAAYDRGGSADQVLHVVHGANWIDGGMPGAGNLLMFNNGAGRPGGNFSSVEEIVAPVDGFGYSISPGQPFGPAEPIWSYSDPGPFYANHLSGAFRMPNGNTLITEGTTGYIFEVTSDGETVWDYQNAGNLARVTRYPLDYLDFDPTR